MGVITDPNPERLAKRLRQIKSELQKIESGGNPNAGWTRAWFDLHNEEVEIEEWMSRHSEPAPSS